MRSLVIHGHFYQPPRENPWTGLVEPEASAAPFPNWNDRIHTECYRANGWARIYNGAGRILRIDNNYEHLSFNFGPTLLSWLEHHHPRTYARVQLADKRSVERLRHGNAIAQAYNHAILPLCNPRDLRTQIVWGLADFEHRFGRAAAAMWLPETACNEAVLEALIEHGLRFAILAPHQAAAIRAPGKRTWRAVTDATLDTSVPYFFSHRDGSGRRIALFFYAGPTARAVAFESVLQSSEALVKKLAAATTGPLVHIATDGETFGHHFRFGDLTLAHAFHEGAAELSPTNYAAYLEQHPAEIEVRLAAGEEQLGTSWSCAHGVGRWMRDCGCSTGGEAGWNQAWRTPIRAALNLLRDAAQQVFASSAGVLFKNPWQTRDRYIDVVLGRMDPMEFLSHHVLDAQRRIEGWTHLELQRSALLMFTSCGWFFADPSGLETTQILKYAGRALDQMKALGLRPPAQDFLALLRQARSNVSADTAHVFSRFVEPLHFTDLPQRFVHAHHRSSLGRVLAEHIRSGHSVAETLDLARRVKAEDGELGFAQDAFWDRVTDAPATYSELRPLAEVLGFAADLKP